MFAFLKKMCYNVVEDEKFYQNGVNKHETFRQR